MPSVPPPASPSEYFASCDSTSGRGGGGGIVVDQPPGIASRAIPGGGYDGSTCLSGSAFFPPAVAFN